MDVRGVLVRMRVRPTKLVSMWLCQFFGGGGDLLCALLDTCASRSFGRHCLQMWSCVLRDEGEGNATAVRKMFKQDYGIKGRENGTRKTS